MPKSLASMPEFMTPGNREVTAKPRLCNQGKPDLKAGVEGTVRCRYCSDLVIPGQGKKYSQCGATL